MTLSDKLKNQFCAVNLYEPCDHDLARVHGEYKKMRDIAVILSEALSLYAKQDNSSNMFIVDYVSPSVALEAITKCEAWLKGSGE